MTRRRIAGVVVVLALVLVAIWFLSDDEAAESARDKGGAIGTVRVEIVDADRADIVAQRLVVDSELAQDTADAVNELIELPDDVTIVLGGDPDGPFYEPETRTIEYPWSFVTESRALLAGRGYASDELDSATVDATRFILHHELGHALIDQLDLPVLGREEDAADGFAAYVAVEHEEDGELVIAATDLFAAFDEQAGDELDQGAFFDSHSLDLQRFYAISCQVYGADEEAYASVVDGIGLDDERLAECPTEWEQLRDGWEAVLAEHLR